NADASPLLRESLPPSHRDDRDDRGVDREELEDARPPSDAEVREAVLSLPRAHSKSPNVVLVYACKLPRSVFVDVLDEVREAVTYRGSRNPVGLLVYRLRIELEQRSGRPLADIAAEA